MNPKKWLRKHLRLRRLKRLGDTADIREPKCWLFIVGCYNSGTTLLHDMLASHPDIATLPREGQYCTDQFLIPSEIGLARAWALQAETFLLHEHSPPPPEAIILQRQWSHQMQPAGSPVFLEKSIPNAGRIRWLNAHFRNAAFIGLIRNGYAVAEGIARKSPRSLSEAARQWRTSNEIMLRDLARVPRKRLITYEQLTDDPAATLDELFSFTGLDSTAPRPDNREWRIHGVNSKIQNMNPQSLARLAPEQYQEIDRQAGTLLRQLGYGS